MKLQGLGLINLTLNHWLKKYGFDARVRGVDEDFFWYHDDTISYSFFFPKDAKKNWDALLEELGCQYDVDLFFSAFLHEVGHSETYHTFEEEIIEECDELCELIATKPDSFDQDLDYVYTHMPVEYEASRWAVEYINANPQRIKELVSTVGKALDLFYKLNNVVDYELFDFS